MAPRIIAPPGVDGSALGFADPSWAQRIGDGLRHYRAMHVGLKRPAAYLNWLRANGALRRGDEAIRSWPLKLTIDTTNVCQLRCPLCPTGMEILGRDRTHADPEVFARLIEELGDYLFLVDLFNWSEPLLNKHLESYLARCRASRIATRVSTNLSLELDDERLERLVESGVNEILVSLDGCSEESYARYRRGGRFATVMRNLERLTEIKARRSSAAPWIIWQFIVFRHNEHELGEAVHRARELGVDWLMLTEPILDTSRFDLPAAERAALAAMAPETRGFSHLESDEPARALARRHRCDWHYLSAAINADGTVSPCCTVWKPEDDLGDLTRQTFADVYRSDLLGAMRAHTSGRRAAPSGTICDACPTPAITTIGREINKQIALSTLVGIWEALRTSLARVRA